MNTPDIRTLLLEHHLAIQKEKGRKITEKEFAEIIGINDKYYNNIYNLRRPPSEKIIKQLADFFNDLRFYDAVKMERPDEGLNKLSRNWFKLSNRARQKIDKLVEDDLKDETRTKPRKDAKITKP